MTTETSPIRTPPNHLIPILESGEPLVDLRDLSQLAFSPVGEKPGNLEYTKIRLGVFHRLVAAQDLLPSGLKLCLTEGYRSLSDQKQYFTQRYELVRAWNPDWSHTDIFMEACKMVAPFENLDGSVNIPPHSTGGAIDVVLIDDEGAVVEMGIHPFDCLLNDPGNAISASNSTLVSVEAQKYRQIMAEALSKVGFINYPLEYWHWSYGERDWALATNSSHAIYGPASGLSGNS